MKAMNMIVVMFVLAIILSGIIKYQNCCIVYAQGYSWRELTFILYRNGIINVKFIMEIPLLWDMSSPLDMRIEAYSVSYPENISNIYMFLILEFREQNNYLASSEYYIGIINESNRNIITSIKIYPTPELLSNLLGENEGLFIYVRPMIKAIIMQQDNWQTYESPYASPFIIYMNTPSEIRGYSIHKRTIIIREGDFIIDTEASIFYPWKMDRGDTYIDFIMTPILIKINNTEIIVNVFINDEMVLSEYLGILNYRSIEKRLYIPTDIISAIYSLLDSPQLLIKIELLFSNEDMIHRNIITFSINCYKYEEQVSFILERDNITTYAGLPIEIPYRIINHESSHILLRKVTILGLNNTITEDLDIILRSNEIYENTIDLSINEPGTYRLNITTYILKVLSHEELVLHRQLIINVLNSLIISVDKTILKPDEHIKVDITTILNGVQIYLALRKSPEERWQILETFSVSFPGTTLEISIPNEGEYQLMAYTANGVKSNIIILKVVKPQISIDVNPSSINTRPNEEFDIKIKIMGINNISDINIETYRYEELVNSWVVVPCIVNKQTDDTYTVKLTSPEKPDKYKYKVKVVSDEASVESQEILVNVINETVKQEKPQLTSNNSGTSFTNLEIIPMMYLYIIIPSIAIFAFLLWRKFRRA